MELKFVSKESDYLVFETTDGQRLRALLDDTLREAIRKVENRDISGLNPKDIQMLIRSGHSVDEVAQRFGVPNSAVEPFAAPILDELTYVLQAALSTKVSDGQGMITFEDLVLRSSPEAKFRAYKQDREWHVATDTDAQMIWEFSPKSRLIEPLSEAAKKLQSTLPNPREVISASPNLKLAEAKPADPASEVLSDKQHDHDGPEAGASVHDLVEELRSRRQAETDVKPQPAKGRASLPSWDEIVLGTGHLDSESD